MVIRGKNIGFKALSLILVLSIGLWTASKAIYYHAHILPDGCIVYHAHPYKKAADSAPFKQHKHTDAQLASINSLNLAFFVVLSTLLILLAFTKAKYCLVIVSYVESYTLGLTGRSPPAFLFSI